MYVIMDDDQDCPCCSGLSSDGDSDTVDCSFLCGCSSGDSGDRFIDIFNFLARLFLHLNVRDPGKKQRLLDKILVVRLCVAMLFNVTVLFIALFNTDPHFMLVLFFAACVIGYVILVVLLSFKLWKVGFRAKFYIVYLGVYKVVEMFVQVCILILLSAGDGAFSGGVNSFFSVVSIIDLILDFFQIIWFVFVHHSNKNIVKPFHGKENTEFCCITHI